MATSGHVADTALSDEAFYMLFLMVEENECLWRMDHEGYKNVHNKDRIWKNLCTRLQETFLHLYALTAGTYNRTTCKHSFSHGHHCCRSLNMQ